jgi:hypothetical protein
VIIVHYRIKTNGDGVELRGESMSSRGNNNLDIIIIAAIGFLAGCGPTEAEAGRAVMTATPVVLGVHLGLMQFMLWLWRKKTPELAMDLKPILIALAVSGLGALWAMLGAAYEVQIVANTSYNGFAGVMEWVPAALLGYGTTYLMFALLTWRVWLWLGPGTAFSWSFLPALVALWFPCPIMSVGVTDNWLEFWSGAWIYPGCLGAVTVPVLIVLVSEILIRLWLVKRKKKSSQESQRSAS